MLLARCMRGAALVAAATTVNLRCPIPEPDEHDEPRGSGRSKRRLVGEVIEDHADLHRAVLWRKWEENSPGWAAARFHFLWKTFGNDYQPGRMYSGSQLLHTRVWVFACYYRYCRPHDLKKRCANGVLAMPTSLPRAIIQRSLNNMYKINKH